MNSVIRFLLGLFAITGVVFVITLGLSKASVIARPSYLNATLSILAISTALIFLFLDRTPPRHPLDFVRNFMLSVVMKIILSGVYIFIILRLDPAGAYANVSFFIVTYFLFTAYEVTWFAIKKNTE